MERKALEEILLVNLLVAIKRKSPVQYDITNLEFDKIYMYGVNRQILCNDQISMSNENSPIRFYCHYSSNELYRQPQEILYRHFG